MITYFSNRHTMILQKKKKDHIKQCITYIKYANKLNLIRQQ